MKKTLIDRDRLMNADAKEVATLTVLLFDRLQGYPYNEPKVLALASAFLLTCDAMKVPAQDAFVACQNLMTDDLHPSGLRSSFAAMSSHLKDDILCSARIA